MVPTFWNTLSFCKCSTKVAVQIFLKIFKPNKLFWKLILIFKNAIETMSIHVCIHQSSSTYPVQSCRRAGAYPAAIGREAGCTPWAGCQSHRANTEITKPFTLTFAPMASLESPVNPTPLTAYVWTVLLIIYGWLQISKQTKNPFVFLFYIDIKELTSESLYRCIFPVIFLMLLTFELHFFA